MLFRSQPAVAGDDNQRELTRTTRLLRPAKQRVIHIAHKGRRLALLALEDVTQLFHARTVLDTSEYAALLVDEAGRVLTFNKPATVLFGDLEVGMAAGHLLQTTQGAQSWWEPGLSGRSKLHVEIGPRLFQVTTSAVALPGEERQLFAVSLVPVARVEANDPYGVGSTRRTNVLRPLR